MKAISNIDINYLNIRPKNCVLRPKHAGVDFVPVTISINKLICHMDHQNPRTLQAEAEFTILQP